MIPRDGLFEAEVSGPDSKWRTPHPMTSNDLARALLSLGCSPLEIATEFRKAGIVSYSGYYRTFASDTVPRVEAVLAGEVMVRPMSAFEEAWIALALFLSDAPLTVEGIIEGADSIEHAIPNSDEVAWALLKLRERGWLVSAGGTYNLTDRGKEMIESILNRSKGLSHLRSLEEWLATNPPLEKSDSNSIGGSKAGGDR